MIGRDRALEAWNNSEAVNKAFIVFIAFSTFGKALFAVARSTIGQIAFMHCERHVQGVRKARVDD
jgi:hypothetical protein